jgi:hypothetical protein
MTARPLSSKSRNANAACRPLTRATRAVSWSRHPWPTIDSSPVVQTSTAVLKLTSTPDSLMSTVFPAAVPWSWSKTAGKIRLTLRARLMKSAGTNPPPTEPVITTDIFVRLYFARPEHIPVAAGFPVTRITAHDGCGLQGRCQAVRPRAWISKKTWMREQAAGVTPEMRLAWPSVDGRTRSSFSTISRERPEQAR